MSLSSEVVTGEEFVQLKTNAVKVHYYVVCSRKLWLYARDVRMEPSSDRFLLGGLVQECTSCHQPRRGLLIGHLI